MTEAEPPAGWWGHSRWRRVLRGMSEVIVVGAGVVGLSVAHELRRAGHHVTVVTADVPGSVQSRGLSRIFRLAHADGALTDAAAASLGLWEEWEAEAGRSLLDRVGLLLTGDVSDRETHVERHGGVQRGSGPRHPLAVGREGRMLREDTRYVGVAKDLPAVPVGALENGLGGTLRTIPIKGGVKLLCVALCVHNVLSSWI